MNDRLRSAMLRSGVDITGLAEAAGVDAKTVARWLRGRVPHHRSRLLVAERLGESEATLWPSARPDQFAGSVSTAEVVGAWAHRADVPADLWLALLRGAKVHIDLLGYAYPLDDLSRVPGATIGRHEVHLYNSMFRFDDQMIVTPHLFRAHGYQHPALHLRRLSAHGIFESFAEQFQQVWDTVRPVNREVADGQEDRLLPRP